jgi:hypothetical protein
MNDFADPIEKDLSRFTTKKEAYVTARDVLIARARAHFRQVCTQLEITPEELIGLPVKVRRGRKPKQGVSENPTEAE